jgi:hypothetical protein
MERGFSLQFVNTVRQFLETTLQIVWDSQSAASRELGTWLEPNFSHVLVNQGLLGGDPRTQVLRDRLQQPGPYSLKVSFTPHPQQTLEPITGADFAVVVEVHIDRELYQRKLFLVQLKRGELTNSSRASGKKRRGKISSSVSPHRCITFTNLHRRSGKSVFGVDIHQAERMLFFTPAAVYWLAIPPSLNNDPEFYSKYTTRSSFSARSVERPRQAASATPQMSEMAGPLFPLSPIYLRDPPMVIEIWEQLLDYSSFWRHLLGPRFPNWRRFLETAVQESQSARQDAFVRSLRYDAAAESARSRPSNHRLSVITAHAESVLALSDQSQDLHTVFEYSVPLSQFVLGDVLADGFGDDDKQIIDSLSRGEPDDWLRGRIRDFAGGDVDLGNVPPTKGVLNFTVDIITRLEVTD